MKRLLTLVLALAVLFCGIYVPAFATEDENVILDAQSYTQFVNNTVYTGTTVTDVDSRFGGSNIGCATYDNGESFTIWRDANSATTAFKIQGTNPVTPSAEKGVEMNFSIKKTTSVDADGKEGYPESGNQWRYLSFATQKPDGTADSRSFLILERDGTFVVNSSGNTYKDTKLTSTPVADNTGYYNLKVTVEPCEYTYNYGSTAYDMKWVVKVYDKNDSNALVRTHYWTESEFDSNSKITGFSMNIYEELVPRNSGYRVYAHIKNVNIKMTGFEVLPTGDYTVDADNGLLGIKFNREVNAANDFTGIKLVDAETETINYVDTEKNAEIIGTLLNIPIKKLKNQQKYKLIIPNTIKDINGYSLIRAYGIEYTAVTNNVILSDVDFSVFDKSTVYTPSTVNAIDPRFTSDAVASLITTDGKSMTVKRDVEQTSKDSAGLFVRGTNAKAVNSTADPIEMKVKIKKEACKDSSGADTTKNAGQRVVYITGKTIEGQNAVLPILSFKSSGELTRITGWVHWADPTQAVVDSDGYYNFRITLQPTTEAYSSEYNYRLKSVVYDENNNGAVVQTFMYLSALDAQSIAKNNNGTDLYCADGFYAFVSQYGSDRNAKYVSMITFKDLEMYKQSLDIVAPVGTEIGTLTDEVVVKFNRDVDAATIGEIKMKDSSNTVVSGTPETGSTASEVIIPLNGLDEGDYTLSIPKTVSDTNENALICEYNISYKATKAKNILYTFDPNNYKTGTYDNTEFAALSGLKTDTVYKAHYNVEYDALQQRNVLSIMSGVDDNEYLQNYRGGYIQKNLDSRVRKGRFVIEARVRITGSNGNMTRWMPFSGEEKGFLKYLAGWSTPTGNIITRDIASDGYSYHNMAFVFTRENETENWVVEGYDIEKGSTSPVYEASLDKSIIISDVMLARIFGNQGKTECINMGLSIAEAKVYKTEIPSILSADYSKENRKLTTKLSSEYENLENAVAEVKDTAGRVIVSELQSSGAGDEIVLNLPYGLTIGSSYTVSISNLELPGVSLKSSVSINFTGGAEDVSVYGMDKSIVESSTLKVSLGVTNSTSEQKEVMIFLPSYKADGSLYDVQCKKLSVGASSASDIVSVEVAVEGTENSKIIITDSNLSPYTDVYNIKTSDFSDVIRIIADSASGAWFNGDVKINSFAGLDFVTAKAEYKSKSNNARNIEFTVLKNENVIKSETVGVNSYSVFDKEYKINTKDLADNDELRFMVKCDSNVLLDKKLTYDDPTKTVDILLIAGQSNAAGAEADGNESLKPELGTVHWGTLGNTRLSTEPEMGFEGALGKTWNEKTGHTVLIVQTARGGTGFSDNVWTVDVGEGYKSASDAYKAALASVENQSEYTLGNRYVFWLQGENEETAGWTAEQYRDPFTAMIDGMMSESFSGSASKNIEKFGVLAVRDTSVYYPKNLRITGVRAAQYRLANTDDRIVMASNITENWNSDTSVKSWFADKYANCAYHSGKLPNTIMEVIPPIHYKQKGYNELGISAAEGMYNYINGNVKTKSVSILGENGMKLIANGGTFNMTTVDMPVMLTASETYASNKNIAYTSSNTDVVSIDGFGVITPNAIGSSAIDVTFSDGLKMSFTINVTK